MGALRTVTNYIASSTTVRKHDGDCLVKTGGSSHLKLLRIY